MTGAAGRMGLVVLGLLLVLTYLLLRGAAPDAALHDRRLRAIDALILNEAALQRDVLRASHGLLLNYDPLVAAVARLREVAAELRGRRRRAPGPLIDGIAAALDEQEELVEDFKSAHALLRNSLLYFAHLSRGSQHHERSRPAGGGGGRRARQHDAPVRRRRRRTMPSAAEVAALLDQLAILPRPPPCGRTWPRCARMAA